MEIITVESLMVPIEEYATVSEDATLYEAVKALEKAQEQQDRQQHHYLHREILVLDRNGKAEGKISQIDVLMALEPKYKDMGDMKSISRAGFSVEFLKSMLEKFDLCDIPFTHMCARTADLKVKEFMSTLSEGEHVEADMALCEAVHMFVIGDHQSLLVTRDEKIIGILRVADVFKEVFQTMKSHKLK